MSLQEIADNFGTDKATHGYCDYYERFMPSNPGRMLEIGCMHGASLRMWRDWYFRRNGEWPEIHTVDLFMNEDWAKEEDIKAEGFKTHRGDQSSRSFLSGIPHKFDVIIEDGSHRSDHQITTLFNLFFTHLKPGGLWVTEDLHCCNDPFFWGSVKQFDDTLLGNVKRAGSWFWITFQDHISRYELKDDKILFLWKK